MDYSQQGYACLARDSISVVKQVRDMDVENLSTENIFRTLWRDQAADADAYADAMPSVICVFLFLFQANYEQAHEARSQGPWLLCHLFRQCSQSLWPLSDYYSQ